MEDVRDLLPCEYCGLRVPPGRYAGHTLLCAITSSAVTRHVGGGLGDRHGLDGLGGAGGIFGLLGGFGDFGSGSGGPGPGSGPGEYESNLRLQEAMGGPVRKACRDINAAAPVADEHTMERCPVCLQDAGDRTRVRRTAACSHEFCAECMERWLSEHTTCPVCVTDLSTHGGHRFVMDDDLADLPPLLPSDEPVVPTPVFRPMFAAPPPPPPMLLYRASRRFPSPGLRLTPLRPRTHPRPSTLSLPHPFPSPREPEDGAQEVLYHFGRVRDILDEVASRGRADP